MAYQGSLSHIHALIVEDMAVQQTTLRGQLALLGISQVDVAANADDAYRLIRSRRYGLILCDFNLNARTDGQQLFELVREQNLLPADCLFFMITAESSYASVAAASEHPPDAYLLKPVTASDIEDRLKAMLDKRESLLPINARLAKDDFVGALQAADELLALRNRWFMSALQLKGQTLLKLGRHEDAKTTFEQALEVRPELLWARLGLARAHKAAGRFADARKLAQAIIESKEGGKLVAAYDVIAEAQEASGDPLGALWTLRDASLVVPSCRRHRMVGESAYRNGDLDMAKQALTKAAKSSRGSIVAQPQDSLLLAQTLVDIGEPAEATRALQDVKMIYKDQPAFTSTALAIQAQVALAAGQPEQAEAALAQAREVVGKGKADLATVTLAKAELMAGNEDAGLALLGSAISADHENLRVKQMITKALEDTGHADKVSHVIESATASMQGMVADARKLLRDSRIDEAVGMIENAAHEYPENTGVLLQAAQIQCMALRLKKAHDDQRIDTIRDYLDRLDKLLPGHDRVNMMRRYFRETLGTLDGVSLAH